jgi:hypothetical protein
VPRDRNHPLQVYVTPGERLIIEGHAKATGKTISTFLRNVGTGAVPRAVATDLKAVEALIKVNADQARLGNLLKLYLQDSKPDHVAAARLIKDIQAMQTELKKAARFMA